MATTYAHLISLINQMKDFFAFTYNQLKCNAIICIAALLISGLSAHAQNGTYQKNNSNGSYSVISFQKTGNRVKADVFAWWNSSNSQMGDYSGEGLLKGNTVTLSTTVNDPDCKVILNMIQGKIKASFSHCSTDHLTEDFNGLYTKITDATAGDYIITVPKAYFYKSADSNTKLKAYVLQGDKVTLDMDRIAASKGGWVYVYFTTKAGKDIPGYLPLNELKKAE